MNIVLARSFMKDLCTVSPAVYKRFMERRDLFLQNPYHPTLHNHPLHGEWAGHRSINITGDYRVIFYTKEDTGFFVRIGTHPQLYG